jgi:CheY-like chemotaxis protein
MDGLQFCSLRENDDRLRDIPVLIFSSDVDASELAKSLHANGYVSKLASTQVIVKEVSRYCH